MRVPNAFDYAVVRVVPRVEREEFINVGVILFCRRLRFLDARVALDTARLRALAPGLDPRSVQDQLDTIPLVCAGGNAAASIGLLPQAERFHWLVAPRSTIVQTSPVHSGICEDPRLALDHLLAAMVRLPAPAETQHLYEIGQAP